MVSASVLGGDSVVAATCMAGDDIEPTIVCVMPRTVILSAARTPIGRLGGGLSSPRLAATVSEAGGLGSFGAQGMTPDRIRAVVAEIRALTREPFEIAGITLHPQYEVAAGRLDAAVLKIEKLKFDYEQSKDPAEQRQLGEQLHKQDDLAVQAADEAVESTDDTDTADADAEPEAAVEDDADGSDIDVDGEIDLGELSGDEAAAPLVDDEA